MLVVALLSAFVGPMPAIAAPGTPTYESEPNDTWAQANVLAVDGTIMNGTYSTAADNDWYSVALLAGHTYYFEMGPNTDNPTNMSDQFLELWDPTATTLINQVDDGWNSATGVGYGLFSFLSYTPPADGTYYLNTHYLAYDSAGDYGIRAYEEGALNTGAATITGVVTDLDDSPLEGVEVVDYGQDPWYAPWSYIQGEVASTLTDADGAYSLSVPIGSHRVGFFGSGYYDVYYNQQPNLDVADSFVLASAESTSGIDAQLELLPPLETYVTNTIRASVDDEGVEGNNSSYSAAISADGEYVVFASDAALVAGDTNGYPDWYRKDLSSGEVVLVSVADDGSLGNNGSYGHASVSDDGQFVAFESNASNLIGVEADNNNSSDVFVRDIVNETTVRVSVASIGSEGNSSSYAPSISDDGSLVAFSSDATNLVADDTNSVRDVFVRDLEAGETTRVSVDSEGIEGTSESDSPDISPDGGSVAFISGGTLVEADTNGYTDVYVKTLSGGAIARANVASDGAQANGNSETWDHPSISEGGQFVAFSSYADNLVAEDLNNEVDIFVHDFETNETELVSVTSDGQQSWDYVEGPSISADGRFVAFEDEYYDPSDKIAPAVNGAVLEMSLVAGDVNVDDDIVLHDRVTGSTSMVSTNDEKVLADSPSWVAAIDGDGSVVAYSSSATNLVADDTNDSSDVFASYVNTNVTTPLEGADRYETAIEISQDAFPSASTVVIATGENWPDALGGSALAGVSNGPVLLSRKATLPASVITEIERLGATRAYVLGGTGAISSAAYNTLVGIFGAQNVTRLGGIDRYATANLVAAEVVDIQGAEYDGRAFVATGLEFADALSAAPIAAANGWPVYLSGVPDISDATVAAMQAAGVTDTILLGGKAAMPEGTSITILAAGFDALRIEGADRYETAAKVATYGVTDCGMSWANVAVATGERFPDALAGGPAQGLGGSVLLLSRTASLPTTVHDTLVAHSAAVGGVRFFGGPAALSQATRDAVMAALAE